MRQLVAILTTLFVFSLCSLAQTQIPIVDLPPSFADVQTDPDDDLYSSSDIVNRLLDYYNASIAYQTQLQLLGMPVTVRMKKPRIDFIIQEPEQEQIEEMLADQWRQVNYFYNEVRKIGIEITNKKAEDMLKQIHILQQKNMDKDIELMSLQLANSQNTKYKGLYEQVLSELSNNNFELNTNTVPAIGLSTGASILMPDINNASVGGSPYIGVYLNPTDMLGMPNIIDLWVDISMPHYKSNSDFHYGTLFTTGINARLLPLSDWLEIKNFNWDIKGGIGWFWFSDEMPNTYSDKNVWNGYLFKVETNIDNLATRFPFGVFVSYSWMHNNNKNTTYTMNSNWMGNFSIGLRFYLSGSERKTSSNFNMQSN